MTLVTYMDPCHNVFLERLRSVVQLETEAQDFDMSDQRNVDIGWQSGRV